MPGCGRDGVTDMGVMTEDGLRFDEPFTLPAGLCGSLARVREDVRVEEKMSVAELSW